MRVLDYLGVLAMALVGVVAGAVVVGVAQFFGLSGWIAGPVFCVLVLMFIYGNDRLLGWGMRHLISFLARLEDTQLSEDDKTRIEGNFSRRPDYIGFLAGAVAGMLAMLLIAPSDVFAFLNF